MAVGNGLTNPVVQYDRWYAEMAWNNTYGVRCINETDYEAGNR